MLPGMERRTRKRQLVELQVRQFALATKLAAPVYSNKLGGQLLFLLLLLPFLLQLIPTSHSVALTATPASQSDKHEPPPPIVNGSSNKSPNSNFLTIPGLYQQNQLITPIQGSEQFERLVLQVKSSDGLPNDASARAAIANQTISMVQYYMASCPDCQGFSPHYKRAITDFGAHWRRLVRVFVVNCNDDLNINLCWDQNPTLVVPLVRWYTYPALLQEQNSTARSKGHPDKYLTSVAHRTYIEKQRRDLISLRHATLRFLATILDQLASYEAIADNSQPDNEQSTSLSFYRHLPMRARLLLPIGYDLPSQRNQSGSRNETDDRDDRFLADLRQRTRDCLAELSQMKDSSKRQRPATVEHFIIFENRKSYMGKTIAADWSNWTCSPDFPLQSSDGGQVSLMIHHTSDFDLLRRLKLASIKELDFPANGSMEHHQTPLLFSIKSLPISNQTEATSDKNTNWPTNLNQIQLALLGSNQTALATQALATGLNMRRRRHASHSALKPKTTTNVLGQRLSLQQYYTRRRSQMDSAYAHPNPFGRKRTRRAAISTSSSSSINTIHQQANNRTQRLVDAENINWAPPELYPGVETIRRHFNTLINVHLARSAGASVGAWAWQPASRDADFGEIRQTKVMDANAVISPRDEDLSLLRLTDYYKVLAEIVHKNILSKAKVDGHQLLTTTCLLRQLARHFPFQGASRGASSLQYGRKSMARNYIELLQRNYADRLNQQLNSTNLIDCGASMTGETKQRLMNMEPVSSIDLASIQHQLQKTHDIGLPAGEHFKWSYCAGSEPYLRGHTCSLWVLFHTLTVHEYLSNRAGNQSGTNSTTELEAPAWNVANRDNEYKFAIKYSSNNMTMSHDQTAPVCDPKNPEPALLGSSSSQLYVDKPQYALANIINFVRFYLSCTNCAAHFSCMIQNSRLDFDNPKPDEHLLYLWEAHNRVNQRTKNSHSEDPKHPKHVFPVYEACPTCYLEKPNDSTDFERMKFDRTELVNFIVARYRRSAILNNKIRIEDLYRKPL